MNAHSLEDCSTRLAMEYLFEHVARVDGKPLCYEVFKRDVHTLMAKDVYKVYQIGRVVLQGYRRRWGLLIRRPGTLKVDQGIRVLQRKTIRVKRTPFTKWKRGDTKGRNGYLKKINPKIGFGGHVFWTYHDRNALDPSKSVIMVNGTSRRVADMDVLSRARVCSGSDL